MGVTLIDDEKPMGRANGNDIIPIGKGHHCETATDGFHGNCEGIVSTNLLLHAARTRCR